MRCLSIKLLKNEYELERSNRAESTYQSLSRPLGYLLLGISFYVELYREPSFKRNKLGLTISLTALS